MVVYLFLTLFSGFFPSVHGWSLPRGMSFNQNVIFLQPKRNCICRTVYKNVRKIQTYQIKENSLTWYSLLNPAFSFRDMFVICAFIFLTGMFLLVGGPLFVFSGKAYVDSVTSLPGKVCDLQSNVNKMYYYFFFFLTVWINKEWDEKIAFIYFNNKKGL